MIDSSVLHYWALFFCDLEIYIVCIYICTRKHILKLLFVWKQKQTWWTTVNELRPLYRSWLCRWGIHDSADLRPRHQHQAHASSDICETGQRTTGWRDMPKVPYAPCPGLEPACICIRIKVTSHAATARPYYATLPPTRAEEEGWVTWWCSSCAVKHHSLPANSQRRVSTCQLTWWFCSVYWSIQHKIDMPLSTTHRPATSFLALVDYRRCLPSGPSCTSHKDTGIPVKQSLQNYRSFLMFKALVLMPCSNSNPQGSL